MKRTALTTISVILLIISVGSFTSCKKDDNDPPAVTIQNVSGSYKINAFTYKYGTDPEEDWLMLMDACERDDVMTLKTDKSYTVVDAGVQCAPPGGEVGDWDLPTTTKFVWDGDEWNIDSFDGKVFRISQTYTSGGITEIIKMTFNKQ